MVVMQAVSCSRPPEARPISRSRPEQIESESTLRLELGSKLSQDRDQEGDKVSKTELRPRPKNVSPI